MRNTKIIDLTPEEFENRINSLLTLSFDDVVNYLLYVVDIEYMLSNNTKKESKIIESFINDERLKPFHHAVAKHIYDEPKLYFEVQGLKFSKTI